MKLFKSPLQFSKVNLNILSFPTPLGTIYFDFLFNVKKISAVKPKQTEAFGETFISCWEMEECNIDFLRGDFIPKIPSSMKVESCIAGVWRIKNLSRSLKTVFKATLGTEYFTEFEENPESGEGLISQSFENTVYKLSIGTEDEDFLNGRAYGKSMPSRLRNLITPNMIECMPEGLQINLPPLENEEYVQIQFVIAWSLKKYPEVSTWFAVEQSPSYILQSLNIEE